MRKTPFDERQKRQQDEPRIQEISQKSRSSGKFLGSLRTGAMESRCRWKRKSQPALASASLQTTFGVVRAGNMLMAATPPRPGENPACRRRRGPDEPGKHMTHLRNGQGKHSRSSGRFRGRRWSCRATGRETNPGQEGESHQNKGDVPVPASEAAHAHSGPTPCLWRSRIPLRCASVRQ
jgi:hypothetical protein